MSVEPQEEEDTAIVPGKKAKYPYFFNFKLITSKGHMLPLSELKNSKRKIGQNFISEPYIQSGLFIMY